MLTMVSLGRWNYKPIECNDTSEQQYKVNIGDSAVFERLFMAISSQSLPRGSLRPKAEVVGA